MASFSFSSALLGIWSRLSCTLLYECIFACYSCCSNNSTLLLLLLRPLLLVGSWRPRGVIIRSQDTGDIRFELLLPGWLAGWLNSPVVEVVVLASLLLLSSCSFPSLNVC